MKWKINKVWLYPEVLFINPIGWCFALILIIFVKCGGKLEIID